LIDILLSGSPETVDYQLKQLFGNAKVYSEDDPNGKENQYFSLQPHLNHKDLEKIDISMDNASKENMEALVDFAKKYVTQTHIDSEINNIIDKL